MCSRGLVPPQRGKSDPPARRAPTRARGEGLAGGTETYDCVHTMITIY